MAKHTLIAYVEDVPGVLNRVASLFRRRGFNIDSLTVGHTETPGVSRLTVVVDGATTIVEQVVKQLYKVLDVVKVSDITHDESVDRELALIKVTATTATRSDIMQMCDIFRAKIVDVAAESVIVEITGEEQKIDSLLQLLRPFGLKELVRSGRVAMARGAITAMQIEEDGAKQADWSQYLVQRSATAN